MKSMKRVRTLFSGMLAGLCIAMGGTVFLSVDNRVLGALLFSVGLFCVCSFGFSLFTGRVCYVFDNDLSYALELPFMWVGNLMGTWLLAMVERMTRSGAALADRARVLCEVKLGDGLISIFLLAVLCNILIFIAVEGYKTIPHSLGKYLAMIFGVTVFILCGFEHCVANMYYISLAGVWSGKALLYVLVMTLGNAVGGVLLPLIRKYLLSAG